jgi:hypothetical protein
MANFPLITWQVTAPAFTVANAIGSVSVPAANGKWGFGVSSLTAPYFSDIDTAVNYLASEMTAAAIAGPTSLGISAISVFNFTNNTSPALSPLTFTLSTASASAITLTFATLADAAVYGFASTTVSINSGFVATTTTYNVGNVWMPNGVSGDVQRSTKQRAAVSSSEMSGLSTDIVNWGHVADIAVRATLFPVANAFVWYATQQIYATKAGRLVGDPNNILEVMLQAASTGVEFRIYEQASTTAGLTNEDYLEAKMPGISAKSAATDFITADDEPRLWTLAGMFFRGNS